MNAKKGGRLGGLRSRAGRLLSARAKPRPAGPRTRPVETIEEVVAAEIADAEVPDADVPDAEAPDVEIADAEPAPDEPPAVVIPRQNPSEPLAHKDAALLETKLSRLDEPHVGPLNDLVREIDEARPDGGPTPWFDPDGGGVHARVLVLFDSPGAKAVAPNGSGVISADNDDPASASFFRLRDEAGLPREALVAWNVVPWPPVDGARAAKPKPADLAEAEPWLHRLLLLLDDLRLVVTIGSPALDGWMRYLTGRPDARLLPTLALPNVSPQVLSRDPEARERILTGLRRAAELCR